MLDVAEAVLIEPAINSGATIDGVLDRLHQAMYDQSKQSWGEGPLAEGRSRAMMTTGEARKRTPEETAEMNRKKAAQRAKQKRPTLELLATAFRAYARNREVDTA